MEPNDVSEASSSIDDVLQPESTRRVRFELPEDKVFEYEGKGKGKEEVKRVEVEDDVPELRTLPPRPMERMLNPMPIREPQGVRRSLRVRKPPANHPLMDPNASSMTSSIIRSEQARMALTEIERQTPNSYNGLVRMEDEKEKGLWLEAMKKEMAVFEKYKAYKLVPPSDVKTAEVPIYSIHGVWRFRIKTANGEIVKYKARWCANGAEMKRQVDAQSLDMEEDLALSRDQITSPSAEISICCWERRMVVETEVGSLRFGEWRESMV